MSNGSGFHTVDDLAQRAVLELCDSFSVVLPITISGSATPELRLAAAVLASAIADRDYAWLRRADSRSLYSFETLSLIFNRADKRFSREIRALMKKPGPRRRGAIGGFVRTKIGSREEAA